MQNTRTADFTVINLGSIFLLEARTSTAVAWVEKRLPEDALTFGETVVVERRYIRSRRRPRWARSRMNDQLPPTRSAGSRAGSRRATWVTSGPRRAREEGMSAVSALQTLQLQLLERWSSLLLHTFATMMAEHVTSEPMRSEFIAFYVALAKLHGHVRDLRAESDQPAHAVHT
jgi:hypothetical protein